MIYIEDLIKGNIQPSNEQITLENYLKEMLYITKYMSPRIKATNIATYHAMFYLSYGTKGVGSFSIPWSDIGALCGKERDTGVITKNEAIRERTKVLTKLGCIRVSQNRTGVNNFYVYLPSEIPFVKDAISVECSKSESIENTSNIDCYNDPARRLKIFSRDKSRCVYCLSEVSAETYFLDHIVPRARGGSNYKNNLITSCRACNTNKSDSEVFDFILVNYRKGLLSQAEFITQKAYIEQIIECGDTGEP